MSETTDPIEEAVARAICDAWGYLWNGDPDEDENVAPETSAPDDCRPTKELFRATARTTIAAHIAALEAAGMVVMPSRPSSIWVHTSSQQKGPSE